MEKLESTTNSNTKEEKHEGFISRHFSKITEINRKYATPKIKMTKWVRIALMGLRIYLIVLVIILVYKFFTLVRQ